jgi:hypothetical protein
LLKIIGPGSENLIPQEKFYFNEEIYDLMAEIKVLTAARIMLGVFYTPENTHLHKLCSLSVYLCGRTKKMGWAEGTAHTNTVNNK